jgi:hypothetical protein
MMPFLCDPYCKSKGLTTPAVPSVVPDNVEAVVTVAHNTIFTYCFYDGFAHCYTDATLAKSIDFKKARVGDQSIQDYLASTFLNTTVNIDTIAKQFSDALALEDMNTGDKQLLKEDRVVDGLYYSTPNMNGFPRGTSICSKLYSAMALSYPENVNTCPQRQPILKVGDEFVFSGTFLYGSTERTINFSIRIV